MEGRLEPDRVLRTRRVQIQRADGFGCGYALAFRQARRSLYPASVEDERAHEITEGRAAYTGTALAAPSAADAIVSALDLLANADGERASFARLPTRPVPPSRSQSAWASLKYSCARCSPTFTDPMRQMDIGPNLIKEVHSLNHNMSGPLLIADWVLLLGPLSFSQLWRTNEEEHVLS